jgi:hypothetical protein
MRKISVLILTLSLFSTFLLFGSEEGKNNDPALVGQKKMTRMAAGEQYWKGSLHRLFLGKDYRKLWIQPIEVEFLDLQNEAGGLTPVMAVGGQQTMGLALRGADGRSFTFRGIDKDPSAVLPPILEGTIADRVVQDQMSSAQPAGPLLAEILMKAAGVLNTPIKIVVMPDDPVLGEFQSDFAGLMGTFQEFPTAASGNNPGFAGVTEVLDYKEMWSRLEAGPADRIDSQAFLRVRLVDILMGDWDRHRKQWRWANLPGKQSWQPIPEDRDQAFCRYDGLLLDIARFSYPFFLNFGDKYPGINALTLGSWATDRYILSDLEKANWIAVARDLKTRLTDSVIEEAVKRLPPEYYQYDGARLKEALKKRRDDLLEVADQFYSHLAKWVDIHLTDLAELVEILWINENTVDVQISIKPNKEGQTASEPYYRRRFFRNETKEIRLFLQAGNDTVVTKGGRPSGIRFRIIGGPGQDTFDDSAGGRLRIYDITGDNEVLHGAGTKINEKKYNPPLKSINDPWVLPQDWGHLTVPSLWFGGGPDIGAFIGGGFNHKSYGFRKVPYSSSQTFRAGYATVPQAFRVDYKGEFCLENSEAFFNLSARASGIEILRFYGFGNETSADEPGDYYRVRQEQYSIDPSFTLPLVGSMTFTFGPTFKYSKTKQDEDRIIRALKPYGSDNFGQLGIWGKLLFDSREDPKLELSGVGFLAEGRFFPKFLDVQSTFGSVHSEAMAYLAARSIPMQPTLALRLGMKYIFGDYPFHEAAFIGGGGLTGSDATVRGFQAQRFAGDSCFYGNVELRLRLSEFYFLVPGEMGLFGLGDVGRVYLDGETSNKWHSALGGGLWFSFLERAFTLTVAFADSEERLSFYVRSGFFF